MKATIVDLRYRMKDVLSAIDRGETVTVLYRGKEKAKLTPIAGPLRTVDQSSVQTKNQPFFGIWSDRENIADPVSYVRSLRQPRQTLGPASKKRR
jgi:antitoxin (DNA-binding transcriptional repressor) of toxin-antitoxin stability system